MSEYISLEQYNTYRIKSYAKHVYFPSNEQQLLEIINKHNQVFSLVMAVILFSQKSIMMMLHL